MADEEDEVVVSLPGDTSSVQIVKAGEVETKKVVPVADENDAITDLKGQFAAMTQRATSAEAAAQTATQRLNETSQRLHHVEGEVVSSQLDTVLSGLAAAEQAATAGEQAYAIAFEAGDGAAMARAQRQIAGAEARKQRLEEAKDDLEDAAKRRPAERPQPQRTAPADPVEHFVQKMSPKSAAWIRAHPECVTDPKLNARMLAAHNLAFADGVDADTDEYFDRIEAGIKTTKVVKTADPVEKRGDGRRPSAPAAGGGGGNSGGGVEVRLTKGEAASATDGTLVWNYDDPTGQKRWTKGEPIGLSEMARRKHEGKKSGLYDKSLSEG